MKAFEIKKILIPVDFSETSMLAFDHGVSMAKVFKADLLLVHVIEVNYLHHNVFFPEAKMVNKDNIVRMAEDKINELANDIQKNRGIKSEVAVLTGKISREIAALAKTSKTDLIVMGTHGVSGIEEFFVGSNAARVVMESECPVITIQAHAKRIGIKRIVLPIDNSLASRQKLHHAVVMAEHFNSEIYIAGLLTEDEPEHTKLFNLKIEQAKEFITRHNIPCFTKILKGTNLAKLIIDYTDEVDADLTIIMTEQELDSTGLFMGPIAQQIVNHSKTPVMSIRPEGLNVGSFKNNPV